MSALSRATSLGPLPSVLRNRSFAVLWLGLLVSNLGDWVNYVAIYAVVYQQTHSTLALVGLRLVHIVPELLCAPFAGVLVDRWKRKRALLITPLISAGFVGLLVFAHPVALIFLAEAGLSLSALLFNPAVSAAMPNIVASEHLVQANTLSRITTTIATLVGGLIGGILVASAGSTFAFGLDAASFLVISLLLTTVHVREESRAASVASIEQDLLEGLHYLREHTLVAIVVSASALFIFAPASVFTLGIVFAQSVLHAGSAGYGILLAGLGAGSFVGALWMIAIPTRARDDFAFAVSGIGLGTAITLMGFSGSLVLAALMYGIAGCMAMINGVCAVTLVQRLVPDYLRGRIFGVSSAINHLAAFVSTLIIAAGVGLFGTAGLISASGVIAAITGLWSLKVALRLGRD